MEWVKESKNQVGNNLKRFKNRFQYTQFNKKLLSTELETINVGIVDIAII